MRIVRRPPAKTQLAAQPPKCCSSPDGPPQSSFAGRTCSVCATWGVALPSSCRKGRIRIGGRARRNYLPPPRQNCVATASGDAAGSTGPGTQILRSRGQTWMDGREAARQPVRQVVALVGQATTSAPFSRHCRQSGRRRSLARATTVSIFAGNVPCPRQADNGCGQPPSCRQLPGPRRPEAGGGARPPSGRRLDCQILLTTVIQIPWPLRRRGINQTQPGTDTI